MGLNNRKTPTPSRRMDTANVRTSPVPQPGPAVKCSLVAKCWTWPFFLWPWILSPLIGGSEVKEEFLLSVFSYYSRRNLHKLTSGKSEHFPHLDYTQSCVILYVSTENAHEAHQRGLCFSYNIKFAQEMLFVSFKNFALSKGDIGVPHPDDLSNTYLHFSKPQLWPLLC